MDLNFKLIEKIKKYNSYNISTGSDNIINQQNDMIQYNIIHSLVILNDVFEIEPNKKIRNLHFQYLNFLEKEDYVKCHEIVDELKKIN